MINSTKPPPPWNICRAYALYDQEVSYCQGLSFVAAALLLQMPAPEAFSLLVKIMFNYKMRDIFQNGFYYLQASFYKLDMATNEFIPDLHKHFHQIGCEPHMYSSQWFLTLFTAKFPLNFIYHVLDWFMLDGMPVIFQIAIALLKFSKKELLSLDFEGVLRFFRVSLPKKFLDNKEHTDALLKIARGQSKLNTEKLKVYEDQYDLQKEEDLRQTNPKVYYENKYVEIMKRNLQLEGENDSTAMKLIKEQIRAETVEKELQERFQQEQLNSITANKKLFKLNRQLNEIQEENAILILEGKKIKDTVRAEMTKQESEITTLKKINEEYKTVCSTLSKELQKCKDMEKEKMESEELAAGSSSDNNTNTTQTVNGDKPINSSYNHTNTDQTTDHSQDQKISKNTLSKKTSPSDKSIILMKQNHQLEDELAKTKLELVQSQCKVQELEHRLIAMEKELRLATRSWMSRFKDGDKG